MPLMKYIPNPDVDISSVRELTDDERNSYLIYDDINVVSELDDDLKAIINRRNSILNRRNVTDPNERKEAIEADINAFISKSRFRNLLSVLKSGSLDKLGFEIRVSGHGQLIDSDEAIKFIERNYDKDYFAVEKDGNSVLIFLNVNERNGNDIYLEIRPRKKVFRHHWR